MLVSDATVWTAEAFLSQGPNFERAGTSNARDLENLLSCFGFFGHASAEIISGVIGLSFLVAHFQGE